MLRLFLMGLLLAGLAGCEGTAFRGREAGALGGAAAGAGLGAIIGHQTGETGAGIAIGAAVGALAGALTGNEFDRQRDQLDQTERTIAEQEQELKENRRLLDELKRRGADARQTERGVVVNLPDVLFEFNSADLSPPARGIVGEVFQAVKGLPNRRIAVEGHTDSVGTVAYNQELSEQRAQAVADEMVAQGVSRRRIIVRGFGESDPVASNRTDLGRERNRRVEVIVENR